MGEVGKRAARHGELSAADFLAAKEVAGGFNSLELKIEIGLEVQFHGLPFFGRGSRFTARSKSDSRPRSSALRN